jgi:hypothetical protein
MMYARTIQLSLVAGSVVGFRWDCKDFGTPT